MGTYSTKLMLIIQNRTIFMFINSVDPDETPQKSGVSSGSALFAMFKHLEQIMPAYTCITLPKLEFDIHVL